MYRRILFVCTGNICRSAMAEGMLKAALANEGGHEVRSAGLRGLDGEPAHKLAVEVAAENDVDLSPHRARTVDPDLLRKADLILAMEMAHKRWIVSRMPALADRVHLMDRRGNRDIPDPMGGTYADFKRTFDELTMCIGDWLPAIRQAEKATKISHATR